MTIEEKPKCFVIMPIADIPGYEPGHFGRVYEHIFKPAIIQAGYTPIRADDTVKTDYIVVGIIQMILECEMVICDLSARNPNVMYELGIRHAFNKPVALIKDQRTEKVFDIQGLRYIEYNESLRIDSVQKDISRISNSIQETVESVGKGINSVVQLAGLSPADVPERQTISGDTQIILSAIGAIEQRIDDLESNSKSFQRHFVISNGRVEFSPFDTAGVGDELFKNSQSFGTIADIHPHEDKIYVAKESGKVVSFGPHSAQAKGLSSIPF